MIPKIIHYIWLSDNEYPEEVQKCISSWESLEGFTLRKWTLKDFNLDEMPYVKKMVEHKLWAFASDYLRLKILAEEGGIYFDTDVKVLKPFDDLLENPYNLAWITQDFLIGGPIMMFEKDSEYAKKIFEYYKSHCEDTFSPRVIEAITTPTFKNWGLKIFDQKYFYPKEKDITEDAYFFHIGRFAWRDALKQYRGENNYVEAAPPGKNKTPLHLHLRHH